MNNKEKVIQFKKNEYNEFFSWLLDKENIKLEKEIDISKILDYKEPYVYYTPEIKNFFETKAMKRLGKIGQLVNIFLYNPNASHTRLHHCKGAYQKMLDFYMLQYKKPEWRERNSTKASKLEVLANMMDMASHDIGHNFCSHALEGLIGEHKGAHEVLGNIILHENEEVVQAFNNINPKLLEALDIVKQANYGLHTLKEGNIDFDRADFLVRDSLYLGVENGFYSGKINRKSMPELLDKVTNGCEIYTIQYDGKDIEVPVFSYEVEPAIEQILQTRTENYENIYVARMNRPRDIFLEEACKTILAKDDTNSDLKVFLNYISENNIESIVEEFLEWNDIRFYNSLFHIIDNTSNEHLKRLATECLPNLDCLVSIVQERLFPDITPKIDENGREIDIEEEFEDEEDKKFYLRVKQFVKDKESYKKYIGDATDQNAIMNVSFDSQEELEEFLELLENGNSNLGGIKTGISKSTIDKLEKWNCKIKKYNKNEPIFIKGRDNRIYTLDEYPERTLDLSPIEYCGIVGIEEKLYLDGVDSSEIKKCKEIFKRKSLSRDKESILNTKSTKLNSELKDIKAKIEEADGR